MFAPRTVVAVTPISTTLAALFALGLASLAPAGTALAKPPKHSPPAKAAVEIVEVSDIECPFCSRGAKTVAALEERYGELLTTRFVHLPLPFHKRAEPAARAAEAARRQGRFEAMKALLFENQRSLGDADIMIYAEKLGLDLARFARDLADPAIDAIIQRDKRIAHDLEVRGTPAYFINGRRLNGAQPLEKFVELIDEELAARPNAKSAGPKWLEARAKKNNATLHRLLWLGEEPAGAAPTPTVKADSTVYRASVDPKRDGLVGPAVAPLTAVAFIGYQCPFSKRHEATLDALREKYGDQLRVVIKHNPLDFHKNGRLLASMAICAHTRSQAAFGAMHDALMALESPDAATREDLLALATDLGHDRATFETCLEAPTTSAHILADIEQATAITARGTPATFINGRKIAGAKPLDEFVALADELLVEAKTRLAKKTPLARLCDTIIEKGSYTEILDSQVNRFDNANAPLLGPKSAPVVVTAFIDFQCPFCARIWPALDRLVAQSQGRVAVAVRHMPLDHHKDARPLANAVLCAHDELQGRFADFVRELFASQTAASDDEDEEEIDIFGDVALPELPDHALIAARKVGLDIDRFELCRAREPHRARIDKDLAESKKAGVRGTPTLFINGRKLGNASLGVEGLQSVIDRFFPAK